MAIKPAFYQHLLEVSESRLLKISCYLYDFLRENTDCRIKHYTGALGSLDWVDARRLADGAAGFRDIHEGKAAAPKIVLRP